MISRVNRLEIPILVAVHEAEHGGGHETGQSGEEEEEAAFGDIVVCTITLADSAGNELGAYKLSDEFKKFNVVQLGSTLLGINGWEYVAVGNGFNGTFNDVLAHFLLRPRCPRTRLPPRVVTCRTMTGAGFARR